MEPEGCGEEWEAEEMRRAIEAKEDWDDEDEEYQALLGLDRARKVIRKNEGVYSLFGSFRGVVGGCATMLNVLNVCEGTGEGARIFDAASRGRQKKARIISRDWIHRLKGKGRLGGLPVVRPGTIESSAAFARCLRRRVNLLPSRPRPPSPRFLFLLAGRGAGESILIDGWIGSRSRPVSRDAERRDPLGPSVEPEHCQWCTGVRASDGPERENAIKGQDGRETQKPCWIWTSKR